MDRKQRRQGILTTILVWKWASICQWWLTTDLYRMKTVLDNLNIWLEDRDVIFCLLGLSYDKPFFCLLCRAVPARLSRCPPPRPASTVTPKSTWLPLTFSPARNSKISVHPHTTWRCQTSSVGTSKWVKIITLQSNSDHSEALAQGLLFTAVRRSQQESTVASCSSASPTI